METVCSCVCAKEPNRNVFWHAIAMSNHFSPFPFADYSNKHGSQTISLDFLRNGNGKVVLHGLFCFQVRTRIRAHAQLYGYTVRLCIDIQSIDSHRVLKVVRTLKFLTFDHHSLDICIGCSSVDGLSSGFQLFNAANTVYL